MEFAKHTSLLRGQFTLAYFLLNFKFIN